MKAPNVSSSIDIAYWFFNKAIEEKIELEDIKLHQILYLSQSYFTVIYEDELLMPSLFLASINGAIEPQLARILENGKPYIQTPKLPVKVVSFLESIWNKYKNLSQEEIVNLTTNQLPYIQAMETGELTPIDFEYIKEFYKTMSGTTQPASMFSKKRKTKLLMSYTGKPVEVKKWEPKRVN